MELRAYLEILRRRRLLILTATLVVAAVAAVTSGLRTPLYQASSQVLLRPGDPSEQLSTASQPAQRNSADSDRYLAAQLDVVESQAVADQAAQQIKGSKADDLLDEVSAAQAGATDIIRITATDTDPQHAAAVANAFAKAYIENRRVTAVTGLQRASDELDAKLKELETRIATLDTQIDKASAGSPGTGDLVKPDVSVPPVSPNVQVDPGLDPGAALAPGAGEALKAARYAAAVQYQSLYAQQQNLLVTKTLKRGEAELITEAKVPTAPSSPKPKRDGVLGGVVGLLLGLGVAFLKEQLDDRIRNREEAEEATNLPVLTELPLEPEAAKTPTRVMSHEQPNGVLAESVRGLRTSLTFLGVDQPLSRILVTSTGPGEGKSFVASNLAAVYAQAGLRTVIVSADLRRPRLESIFPEAANGAGFSDVIIGLSLVAGSHNDRGVDQSDQLNEVLAAALRPTRISGLYMLPAGKLPPNPAELLGSQRAFEVFEALSQMADMVVVDTAPVLAVTDAAVLAPMVDGVVLVAAADETHKGALNRAASTLAGAHCRLLGVVLNKVDPESGGSYYGNYYGRYYGQTPAQQKGGRFPWKRGKSTSDQKVGAGSR